MKLFVLVSIIAGVFPPATSALVAPSWSTSRRPRQRQRQPHPASSLSSSSSSSLTMVTAAGSEPEMASLYKEQERLLVERGEKEAELMAGPYEAIQANTIKGVGSSGGFSSKKGSSNKKQLQIQGKAHAQVLETEGVVRIDNVLSTELADQMLEYVFQLRQTSEEQVQKGEVESLERFANVLLRDNRCDLTIPLGPKIVADCLYNLLEESPVSHTISTLLGPDAELYELSCLISDPGSQRQVMHPDTPYLKSGGPVLYTCFFALQDVELDMGPTVWMPRTHTQEAHATFKDDVVNSSTNESPKDHLLRTRPVVLGTLPKGCCGIYDSRLLHCGGANASMDGKSRAIFYFSFKSSKIGYPGNPASIRKNLAGQHTLISLSKELKRYKKGKSSIVFKEEE